MLFLLRCLLFTIAVITRRPERRTAPTYQPTQPMALAPAPSASTQRQQPESTWGLGPVIPTWPYHRFLRRNLSNNPNLQEIVLTHFVRCFQLETDTPTHHIDEN